MAPAKLELRFGELRQLIRWTILPACAATLMMSGCLGRRARPAIPWATAGQIRPTLPARTSAPETQVDPVPELHVDVSPPVTSIGAARSAPPRPRGAAAAATEHESGGQPDAPLIVPELTSQQRAALQQQAQQSLEIAEHNLAGASGKSLNATQIDLASKVRSFIDQAREAARTSDWTQARNLARKAQVLSEALANSL